MANAKDAEERVEQMTNPSANQLQMIALFAPFAYASRERTRAGRAAWSVERVSPLQACLIARFRGGSQPSRAPPEGSSTPANDEQPSRTMRSRDEQHGCLCISLLTV